MVSSLVQRGRFQLSAVLVTCLLLVLFFSKKKPPLRRLLQSQLILGRAAGTREVTSSVRLDVARVVKLVLGSVHQVSEPTRC